MADALSRAPASDPQTTDLKFINEVIAYIRRTIEILPASAQKLDEIRQAQETDTELSEIRKHCLNGWPGYMPQNPLLQQYFKNRQHLTIVDDLLFYDDRIVIPLQLRLDTLNRLHEGHQGVTKCQALARTSVWWPNITGQIEEMVRKCQTCSKLRPAAKEPLLPSSIPDRPWSRLGMDLFELKGKTYLIVVDYLSRWIDMRPFHQLSSAATINAIKSVFATHGIPDVVMSDNGPQFSSYEFQKFAENYGFTHTTSSPKFPQSNGEAERAVQTLKNLLKKSDDPYLALLTYRSTPIHNGLAPSEILMGRKLRTRLPVHPSTLQPTLLNKELWKKKEEDYKEKQRLNYNARHAVKTPPNLNPGDSVFIKDMQTPGQILERHNSPRSFIVRTEKGTLRRNQSHLVATPGAAPPTPRRTPHQNCQPAKPTPPALPVPPATVATPGMTTRSGRAVKAPDKLNL
ncbi:hypothetical protein V1264_008127 [Littorina saxatilis]|uniref:Integrase catalytic domain-containing protein n=1 Tax=Littorina saxatilis TaxID=31220 RepID=A0AAN9G3A0_9CAEN